MKDFKRTKRDIINDLVTMLRIAAPLSVHGFLMRKLADWLDEEVSNND
jgi:hypothetical protein